MPRYTGPVTADGLESKLLVLGQVREELQDHVLVAGRGVGAHPLTIRFKDLGLGALHGLGVVPDDAVYEVQGGLGQGPLPSYTACHQVALLADRLTGPRQVRCLGTAQVDGLAHPHGLYNVPPGFAGIGRSYQDHCDILLLDLE